MLFKKSQVEEGCLELYGRKDFVKSLVVYFLSLLEVHEESKNWNLIFSFGLKVTVL